jgi:hypothetical protein
MIRLFSFLFALGDSAARSRPPSAGLLSSFEQRREIQSSYVMTALRGGHPGQRDKISDVVWSVVSEMT